MSGYRPGNPPPPLSSALLIWKLLLYTTVLTYPSFHSSTKSVACIRQSTAVSHNETHRAFPACIYSSFLNLFALHPTVCLYVGSRSTPTRARADIVLLHLALPIAQWTSLCTSSSTGLALLAHSTVASSISHLQVHLSSYRLSAGQTTRP